MSTHVPIENKKTTITESDRGWDAINSHSNKETQTFASREKALEYATKIAARNKELMRRLA